MLPYKASVEGRCGITFIVSLTGRRLLLIQIYSARHLNPTAANSMMLPPTQSNIFTTISDLYKTIMFLQNLQI